MLYFILKENLCLKELLYKLVKNLKSLQDNSFKYKSYQANTACYNQFYGLKASLVFSTNQAFVQLLKRCKTQHAWINNIKTTARHMKHMFLQNPFVGRQLIAHISDLKLHHNAKFWKWAPVKHVKQNATAEKGHKRAVK